MTRSRFFLSCLGLVLIVVGAGFYFYQQLPELLRRQSEHFLQQYGVEDIEFEGLQWSTRKVSVDTLTLRGTYEHYTYKARLASGELHYNWRMLLNGKVESLVLSSIELSITQTAASDSQTRDVIAVDELLPQHLIDQLPLRVLRIKQWRLDYRSMNFPMIIAQGSLLIDEHVDLELRSTVAGGDLLAKLQSDQNTENVTLALSLGEDQSKIATMAARLARAADKGWEWNLQGQVQHTPMLIWLRQFAAEYPLELRIPAENEFTLQGESSFSARVRHPNTLHLTAAADSEDTLQRQLKASIHVATDIRQLDLPTFMDKGVGTLIVDATLENARFEGNVQPFKLSTNLWAQRLSLPKKSLHWLRWERTIPLYMETTEPLNIASGDLGNWSVQLHNAVLSLGENDSRLHLQKLSLDAHVETGEQVQATTQFSARVSTRLQQQTLPQLEIALTQRGSIEHSQFQLQLFDTTESVRAELKGNVNLAVGSGDYQLSTKIQDLAYFSASTVPLLQHFKLLQGDAKIDSGTLHLDTALKSVSYDVANWEQQSQLRLENVSGTFDEYRFERFELTADWSGITQWRTRQAVDISLTKLNAGFEVHNIALRMSLPKSTPINAPQVRLEAFSAGVFGGQLVLPQAQDWDFSAPSNQITLRAQQWQLADLVALQKNADIQARGTLEGELPITLADGRIIINNGYLRALPPGGSIRYVANEKSRALADSSPELELALDLLSDFQYQVLSSEVQLDKAGNLLLGLSLAGSNPAKYKGQPINFNINLEQNLDPLLQSLRLSANLVKRIESGLK